MASFEDRTKGEAYKKFHKKYFETRTDWKTKVINLNQKEKEEFFREQQKYVERKFQKAKYNQDREEYQNDPLM